MLTLTDDVCGSLPSTLSSPLSRMSHPSVSPGVVSGSSPVSHSPAQRPLDEEPYVQVNVAAAGQQTKATATADGSQKNVNWQNHAVQAASTQNVLLPGLGSNSSTQPFAIKSQLAMMLKGGVIMGQTNELQLVWC
jgi:hypothetical protein